MLPLQAAANPIQDENALAGSPGWERSEADAPRIEGYTSVNSVAPGQAIGFRVSTSPVQSYRIIIYRLGWYGGAGARQMTCLPSCSTSFAGAARTTPAPDAATGRIDAAWPQSASLTIPSTWVSGEYVAEYVLVGGSSSGQARYSPFVVRSSAPAGSAILIQVPYNTYLAYNKWGGTSAYDNLLKKSNFKLSHATKVSFNRPYHQREWRFWDIQLVRFLEREGYDVSYVTDADVDADPSLLLQHRAVIASGHGEYWTKGMRNAWEAARDAGTNLAFFGANDAYWQVRYEDSSCSGDAVCANAPGDRRTMVIYKEYPDPIPNPADDTIQFRDLDRPECELQGGVMYGSWLANDGYRDYTVTAAGAADSWLQGTGLVSGSKLTGLMGFEYDSFWPDCQTPGPPKILFQYQGPETSAAIDAAGVKYEAPSSGARVFSSGSLQFDWGLDSYRWDPVVAGVPTDTRVQQLTRNMLKDLTSPASPAGLAVTQNGVQFEIDTTPRGDPRVSSHKIYRHAGSGDFAPGDPGVTLVCQNAAGDCSDTPGAGSYRYASVAVDAWGESAPRLSPAISDAPPTAVDDTATVTEDSAAAAISVLANDTDTDGGPKAIASATQPANGTVALTGGSPGAHTGLTYQPDANYCNKPPGTTTDSFTYTLNGDSSATVRVTVNCVDDSPVAVGDTATVNEDAAAAAISVLANDTDADGGTKTIASRTQPANGNVVITGGGTGLTYQPNANYCNKPPGTATDDFTNTLNGGSSATVSVSVNCADDSPVAVDDTATTSEDAAAGAIDVLANDTDIDGGSKAIASATQPANGTVALTGGSAGAHTGLTYQPDANYCNNPPGTSTDGFTYNLNGGSTAAVRVTVSCADDPPVAVNDSATVSGASGANPINVLANDTDIDGGPKAIASTTQPANGTVTLTGGTPGAHTGLTYQPDPAYCNDPPTSPADTFSYTLTPGASAATVSVTVDCGSPPAAVNDSTTVSEGDPPTAIDVLANDTDADGGPKAIASATQPANGSVAITGGGAGLTYQPDPAYCNDPPGTAPDTFTYALNGGSSATVSVSVTCPPQDLTPPVVWSFSSDRKKLRVGAEPTAKAAATGTTFRFSLSEAAIARIQIIQLLPGRVSVKRCSKPTASNRDRPRCTRRLGRGSLIRDSGAGPNAVAFSGRIGLRALKPGNYKARITARDAEGNTSTPKSLAFKVVKG